MSCYAVDVPIFGTVYIKASTAVKAQQILNRLVSRAIDARDRAWFSDVAFEYLPRVSFSSSLTLYAPLPGAQIIEVSERTVDLAQRSFILGSRDVLVPFAQRAEDFTDMPVFTTDIEINATAFIKAESPGQAAELVAELGQGDHIELQMGYWLWFSKVRFEEGETSNFPVVLSSGLRIVGPVERQLARADVAGLN